MCFAIPKKVVGVRGDIVIVENKEGKRTEAVNMVEAGIGEYVIIEGNVAMEKLSSAKVGEMFTILHGEEAGNER